MTASFDDKDVFVGLDLGTSGVRAVAIDSQGTEISVATTPLRPPVRAGEGHSEQHPAAWWRACVEVLRELNRHLAGYRVRIITVDGTSSTLLLSAADGEPLTPGLMYDDQRAARFVPSIAQAAPLGTAVSSASSSLAKLLYLLESMPRSLPLRALHQADWILGKLTGRFGVSDENNCLKLGYDAVQRRWPEWLDHFDLPRALLPEVHPPGTPVALVTADASTLTGLPADCMVAAGTTDSVAAAVASGISGVGEAVTSLGSTLVLKVFASDPLFEPGYGIYSHRLDNLWLVGGASNSGGAVLAHYFSKARLAALSAEINPEGHSGLDYYPLLRMGERFPFNDPGLPPRMSPRPERDHLFLQGMLEGMAAIEALGYRRLAEFGAPFPTKVWSIGGGADNEPWRRLRQLRLGVPVLRSKRSEAAYGAALLGLRASGGWGSR